MRGGRQREDLGSGQHGAGGAVPGAQPGKCLWHINPFLLAQGSVPWVTGSLPISLQSCQCLAWKPRPVGLWPCPVESQHVVAGYSDGTVRVFSVSRTEMELKMHPHAAALTAITYSTDGEAV